MIEDLATESPVKAAVTFHLHAVSGREHDVRVPVTAAAL